MKKGLFYVLIVVSLFLAGYLIQLSSSTSSTPPFQDHEIRIYKNGIQYVIPNENASRFELQYDFSSNSGHLSVWTNWNYSDTLYWTIYSSFPMNISNSSVRGDFVLTNYSFQETNCPFFPGSCYVNNFTANWWSGAAMSVDFNFSSNISAQGNYYFTNFATPYWWDVTLDGKFTCSYSCFDPIYAKLYNFAQDQNRTSFEIVKPDNAQGSILSFSINVTDNSLQFQKELWLALGTGLFISAIFAIFDELRKFSVRA